MATLTELRQLLKTIINSRSQNETDLGNNLLNNFMRPWVHTLIVHEIVANFEADLYLRAKLIKAEFDLDKINAQRNELNSAIFIHKNYVNHFDNNGDNLIGILQHPEHAIYFIFVLDAFQNPSFKWTTNQIFQHRYLLLNDKEYINVAIAGFDSFLARR